MEQLNAKQERALPAVRLWLFAVALLIFAMVIVGGATRLTNSGLSITEWKPLLGAIPPLDEADWQLAFDKYKLIPQARELNSAMTLEEFKFIFWWEWAHRFLGRFIGVAFAVPFLFFAVTGRIAKSQWPKLVALFVLGGLQGALGWYMVASGLETRVDVSQYRLAAHLTLAAAIYAAMLWVALGLGRARQEPASSVQWAALLLPFLVLLQMAAGGFVAGLDAGLAFNTWPLMDGTLVPNGLFVMTPAWRNFFENAMTVQFDHRLLAYGITLYALLLALVQRTKTAALVAAAVLLQVCLGIWTLLAHVPLHVALTHQGGALAVLAAAVWNLHATLMRSPAPDRR
ncbi:COX15/CtaA family protein [Aestuariivirga sp.]|uniref:COX15/CtaA family protein n=1 Tax=Aestuariivirga sp. TaxID=2650926 RepID=UPI0039E257C2